jgi:putative transcriptional regulator
MTAQKINKGNLLIANPQSNCDDVFMQSVVLVTDHNSKGSVGFILNKSLNYTIKDVLPEINSNFKIYMGGPVEPDNLYFLHNIPNLIENSVKICDNIYWGGNFSSIQDLLNENVIGQKDIMFFLGYSCWSSNQLEDEIEENQWYIDQNKIPVLNSVNNDWKSRIVKQNPDFAIWINAPKNPSFN